MMKSFLAVLRGPDHIFEFANAAHLESFGDRGIIGRARADVYPELNDQGFADAPYRAFHTGKTVFLRDKAARFDYGPEGKPRDRRLDISYEPMRDSHGKVTGLFVQGRDVTQIGAHPLEMRAVSSGLQTLDDTELLTLLLYHGTLDADSAERAELLLSRFRDLGGVLSASIPSLSQVVPNMHVNTSSSVPSSVALHLKIAQEIGRRVLFNKMAQRPLLSSSALLRTYLRALLASEPRERFMVLFLDQSHRLIACETLVEGTIAHAPVYSREVVRRAIELSATALILVHNHPSGSARISKDDIATTAQIERAASVLDMVVVDHLIVAGDEVVSFSEQGMLFPARRASDIPR